MIRRRGQHDRNQSVLRRVIYARDPPAAHKELIAIVEFAAAPSDSFSGSPDLRLGRLPIELCEQETGDHAGDRKHLAKAREAATAVSEFTESDLCRLPAIGEYLPIG